MIKLISKLHSKIDEWEGEWLLDPNTPIAIAKKMLFQYQAYLEQVEDTANKNREKEESEKAKELLKSPDEAIYG